MKVLLTGATGYIGKRLLPVLCDMGHEVVCCVRDKSRFSVPKYLKDQVSVIQIDLLKEETLENVPNDIDGAYYLVHSMSASSDYEKLEETSAQNFMQAISKTKVQHLSLIHI